MKGDNGGEGGLDELLKGTCCGDGGGIRESTDGGSINEEF